MLTPLSILSLDQGKIYTAPEASPDISGAGAPASAAATAPKRIGGLVRMLDWAFARYGAPPTATARR